MARSSFLIDSARFDQIAPLNSEIPRVLIKRCAISAVFRESAGDHGEIILPY